MTGAASVLTVGVKFYICYKFGDEGTAHVLQLSSGEF